MRATRWMLAAMLAAGPALAQDAEGEAMGLERAKVGDPDVYMTVNFALGSAALSAGARATLDQVAEDLSVGGEPIVLAGHTDASGTEAQNASLAEHRARVVLQYLATHGVAPTRLAAVAHGAREPVDSNDTTEGRAQNRRVDLKLVD